MKKTLTTICLIFFGLLPAPLFLLAETESSTFTITPPLVKINMQPGEEFASGIKVVNNNDRTITVQVRAANFKSIDNGRVEFADETSISGNYTLKEWLTLPQESLEIGPFASKNIPYIIKTPADASPGGHYAGILVGLPPAEKIEGGSSIGISQVLSSLLFVNIKGEIVEKGYIRQFAPSKTFNNSGSTEIDVFFENTGNVHLKPVGEVRIYDLFGKEKGYIPINQKTDFGNVLPESDRRWQLVWSAADDFILLNRYRATLTLSFGEEAKQSDYQETFFWLVNIKLLAIVVGAVLLLFILLFLFIKIYVRQSVKSAQRQMEAWRRREMNQRAASDRRPKEPERRVVDLRRKR